MPKVHYRHFTVVEGFRGGRSECCNARTQVEFLTFLVKFLQGNAGRYWDALHSDVALLQISDIAWHDFLVVVPELALVISSGQKATAVVGLSPNSGSPWGCVIKLKPRSDFYPNREVNFRQIEKRF